MLAVMHVARNVPLAPLTTLRLGGSAAHVAAVEREEEVPEALALAHELGVEAIVLGGGSNVVVGDEGVDAVVVRTAMRGVDVVVQDGMARITLAAGEPWDAFVARAVHEGYAGVECLAGIPGLVGATPIQNVGAYGQEIADTVVAVRVYDRALRRFAVLARAECAFGYRESRLKATRQYVVTAVTFALPMKRESAPIRYPELARTLEVPDGGTAPLVRVSEAVLALRRAKGMVLDPDDPESVSAGSFFVNPVVDDAGLERVVRGAPPGLLVPHYPTQRGSWKVPAAWLIEQSGFARGFQSGHVRVSARHSLALVNDGQATARELLGLARDIVRGVRERFGVTLVTEPVLLGCRL